jgi:hypothetical protein
MAESNSSHAKEVQLDLLRHNPLFPRKRHIRGRRKRLVRRLRDADASILIPEPRISAGNSQARRAEQRLLSRGGEVREERADQLTT